MKKQIDNIISDPAFQENVAWKRRRFESDQFIIREGEEGNTLFFVEQGKLRVNMQVTIEERNKIQQGLTDLRAGDIFGEICLHGSYLRTASVKAISDGTLLEINGEQLNRYLDKNPQTGYLFFKSLFEIFIKRLDLANNRIGSLFVWGLKAHGIDKHL